MTIADEISKGPLEGERSGPEDCLPGLSPEYLSSRERVLRFMIQYTLIESFHKFRALQQPYPFVPRNSLRPGAVTPTKEYTLHNNGLVILLDERVTANLYKHFRARPANRTLKKNLAAVAPNLPSLDDFDADKCRVDHGEFAEMMRLLMPLDYALLIQRISPPDEASHFSLTHFHVKVERLTDNALRSLAIHLGYIRKGLHERDELFAEALEKKFYEYFNFYHNAAGRRSAAALSAQLLMREKIPGTVFVTSQQDRRLTLLTSLGPCRCMEIDQYLLQPLDKEELDELKAWGKQNGMDIQRDFLLHRSPQGGVVLVRARYRHTEVAMPVPEGEQRGEINPREKWVRLIDEAIMPLDPDREHNCILYPMAYRRADEG